MSRVVNTEKIEGFEEEVFRALDPHVWRDLHEIARQIHGPTQKVYRAGISVEVPTTASGSGYQAMCESLVRRGMAMERPARPGEFAPMGKLWKRWP